MSKFSARLNSAPAAPATGSTPRTRFVLMSFLSRKLEHNCIIHLRPGVLARPSMSRKRPFSPFIKFICCAPRTSPWAAYFLDNHFIAYKLLEYIRRHAFRHPAVRLTVNPCPRTSVRFVSVSSYLFHTFSFGCMLPGATCAKYCALDLNSCARIHTYCTQTGAGVQHAFRDSSGRLERQNRHRF